VTAAAASRPDREPPGYSARVSTVRPAHPTRIERVVGSICRGAARVPGLRRVLLSPVVARPGFWLATAAAAVWGCLLLRRPRRLGRIHVIDRLPRWAYGRGGTTIGAIYLTTANTGDAVLEHEAVHVAQWRRYGLAFIPLYIAAGSVAATNRFEVEAGLERGGYARPR